jgi:hypothetical protein
VQELRKKNKTTVKLSLIQGQNLINMKEIVRNALAKRRLKPNETIYIRHFSPLHKLKD